MLPLYNSQLVTHITSTLLPHFTNILLIYLHPTLHQLIISFTLTNPTVHSQPLPARYKTAVKLYSGAISPKTFGAQLLEVINTTD